MTEAGQRGEAMKITSRELSLSIVTRIWLFLATFVVQAHPPQRLVPVVCRARHRISLATPGWRIPSRGRIGRLILLVAFLSVIFPWLQASAGQPTLPADVPNIFDPEVQANYQVIGVANLRGNPDFPAVLLLSTAEGKPEAILLGLDARNGEEMWSLKSDPIILIVVLSEPATIQGLYVDSGFADQGKASGSFTAVDKEDSPALPDLLKAVIEETSRTLI
jgi:hypothetical protein